eukprot:GGOE01008688.1.p2 GENE.GGOE01008688.1~~GGOE01008688.1.p2  ORF type:complete len:151 (+),score=25.95 GGOE01008688.1:165-617(+)
MCCDPRCSVQAGARQGDGTKGTGIGGPSGGATVSPTRVVWVADEVDFPQWRALAALPERVDKDLEEEVMRFALVTLASGRPLTPDVEEWAGRLHQSSLEPFQYSAFCVPLYGSCQLDLLASSSVSVPAWLCLRCCVHLQTIGWEWAKAKT